MSVRRGIRWGCGLTIGYLLVMLAVGVLIVLAAVLATFAEAKAQDGGATADDDGLAALLEVCSASLVERLEAVGTEFPGFQSNEVAIELFAARRIHGDLAGFLSRWNARAVSGVCSAADDVRAVGAALRDGATERAEFLWRAWPSFARPSLHLQ